MESTPRCPFILSLITLMLASGVVMPVVSMDLVDGTLGRSVHFVIPVALPSQYRIDWNCGHAGKVIVIARLTHGGSPQYNPIYGGRSEMLGNGTLRLDNISSEDVGTYKVKVFNPETFTSYIHRYQLNVYATLTAPVLRSIDANRLIISGTDMTLHCDAGDQTVTTYTFYRGQKMICSEPHVTCRGSSLNLTPISGDDSGSYTCRIENPVSSYTSDPIPVTVSAQGSAIAFSWSLDGKPVSSKPPYYITESDSPPYSSLTISPVSRNDIGPFTCTASNLLNSETSNELNLSLNCE
ncbi:carcinoembryonic antigen-related cell adhesion molecule 1-like [Bufo gargarizans]|uniref:carcinoembryonic antigen-related cell adhesion molecule 1-like n=1 Tax=Bufo gargarizans TaxID=30331 RepID=UPI001CF55257|nr:carcinoembryonic antigen-related cell adhesion molecule 1-like [Bufo gargarizans]